MATFWQFFFVEKYGKSWQLCQLLVAVFGTLWHSVAFSSSYWQSVTVCGSQWQSVTVNSSKWQSMAVGGSLNSFK